MTIQVTLNSNQFQRTGTHNNRNYDTLKVKSFGNGRIYLTCIKEQMRLCTMAKQMQLIDGKVIISFGKNDKIVIGNYSEQ